MNNDSENTYAIASIVILLAFILFVLLFIRPIYSINKVNTGENNIRKEAVEAGVAEWYLDEHDEKAFRWKTDAEGTND